MQRSKVMNRTEVVKKLNNRGFNAQERDVVKNGVVLLNDGNLFRFQ